MRRLLLSLAVAALAGCQPTVDRLIGSTPEAGAVAAQPGVSGPVMRIVVPSRGADAVLTRSAISGDIETWMAIDRISVSFRRGVLVGTRGLGFDLMGADAQPALDAMAGTGGGLYRRQMRYLSGENHTAYLNAGCRIERVGRETVRGLSYLRIEEHCGARVDSFVNVFWLDDSGRVARSRQWVSPEIGYIETALLD